MSPRFAKDSQGRWVFHRWDGPWWFVWDHFRPQERAEFFARDLWQAYWRRR